MPGRRQAYYRGWLRTWLLALVSGLVAIGPLAQPSVPSTPGWAHAGSSYPSVSADAGLNDPQDPVRALRGSHFAPPGVLSRLSRVEVELALPPLTPLLLKPKPVEAPPVAPGAGARRQAVTDDVFHRSSVGTARTPTGPPL